MGMAYKSLWVKKSKPTTANKIPAQGRTGTMGSPGAPLPKPEKAQTAPVQGTPKTGNDILSTEGQNLKVPGPETR